MMSHFVKIKRFKTPQKIIPNVTIKSVLKMYIIYDVIRYKTKKSIMTRQNLIPDVTMIKCLNRCYKLIIIHTNMCIHTHIFTDTTGMHLGRVMTRFSRNIQIIFEFYMVHCICYPL